MKPDFVDVFGQESWVIENGTVGLSLTRRGGHMAPVWFGQDTDSPRQPYYVSPWQEEGLDISAPVLVPLRGNFFCLPFGGGVDPATGTRLPLHGETACEEWTFESLRTEGDKTTASFRIHAHTGTVRKELTLREGHNAVYSRHVVEGYSGPFPLGHHAILDVDVPPGAIRVSTSPFHIGLTAPGIESAPLEEEYRSLLENASFADLRAVPTGWQTAPDADLTRFPARDGFTDIAGVYKRASREPAWTAAVCGHRNTLWLALKDPSLLPATLLWIANRGRQASPWNGRNRCLGIEDVCSYAALGIEAATADNPVNREGIPTAVQLAPDEATTVPYIQAAAPVPTDFGAVQRVDFQEGGLVVYAESGDALEMPLDWPFVMAPREDLG